MNKTLGKKNEVKLYDGGLIVLLVIVIILAVVGTAHVARETAREYEEKLARERIGIPDYSDDELIARYYQINAELQGALDDLESARRQAVRYSLEQSKDSGRGGAAGGFAQGFARGYNPGVVSERIIKIKVDILRQIRALYLTEIARRGLKLPK